MANFFDRRLNISCKKKEKIKKKRKEKGSHIRREKVVNAAPEILPQPGDRYESNGKVKAKLFCNGKDIYRIPY